MLKNERIAHDWITSKIRVSTMAIYRESERGPYWLIETWIFSHDPRQRTVQRIHDTPGAYESVNLGHYTPPAERAHRHIVRNLQNKFGGWRAVENRFMWE